MPLSAGLLMFRRRDGRLEVLLAHPGGPYFRRRDEGVWGIPKGEVEPGESGLDAARREFGEETGFDCAPPFLWLGAVRQRGGKRVQAWAFEGDCDPQRLCSNEFEVEWPPRSGRRQRFPELDRARFFDLDAAARYINEGQRPLLDRLRALLSEGEAPGEPGQKPG